MSNPLQTPLAPQLAIRLRIVAGGTDAGSREVRDVQRALTIGRGSDCDVVLSDSLASRRHARVEPMADGALRVIDLGSANGVWIQDRPITDAVVRHGEAFLIGSTRFECDVQAPLPAPPPPADDAATLFIPKPPGLSASPAAAAFIVRVVEPGAHLKAGQEFVVSTGRATLGRGMDATIVLSDRDISRRHATLAATDSGFLLTDAGSSAGVWVDDKQVETALLKPRQQFRLGASVVLECVPAGAEAAPLEAPGRVPDVDDATRFEPAPPIAVKEPDDATRFLPVPQELLPSAAVPAAPEAPARAAPALDLAFEKSVVMPVPAFVTAATRLEDEGESVEGFAHKPFLLDDPETVWYVVNGGVLIFTVAMEKGVPVGPRTHFLGIVAGQCFMGFDPHDARGSAFMAVPKPGTLLRKIPRLRFRELATVPGNAASIAALIDTWVGGLAKSLSSGDGARLDEKLLASAQALELQPNEKATSTSGILWIDIWSGSILFNDLATPVFQHKRTLFPVSPDTWIQPIGDEFGALLIRPVTTAAALRDSALWYGLEVFHQVLCECEFVGKKLATADEYVRLQQKSRHSEAAEAAAYDAIGSVMSTEGATPREFLQAAAREPVLQACAAVGQVLGIDVRAHPAADEGLTFEEQVAAVANASGFRTRVVALRDDWWTKDCGPLVGKRADTNLPVAVLPNGPRSYVCIDPKAGTRTPIDAEVADTIAPFAYTCYRPLPDTASSARDLIAFGARGVKSDLWWVLGMAIAVGMFGMVTPYLTGQLFDTAIPQAERTMLWTFGVALLFSALASTLFKLTQGVAVVRVQSRLESSIQAAVWDRILNLPVSFFRKYSAGDLADRAGGVDQIQQLISGAGVAAILGSVSGVFYIFQMFTYDLRLAFAAIVLTMIFVGTNMLANYLQLRHQRVEMQLRGRIAGLVLNLISGVSKLRISGAEPHAFRVWAQQFAEQRRISFKIGTIKNTAATFATTFPVLSTIAIFLVMVSAADAAAEAGQPMMTTGAFIAFTTAYALFLAAMQSLGDASLNMLKILPIYERLRPIIEARPEVDRGKAFPGKLTGGIELSRVHFRYEADSPWIVKDLSLSIQAGEFVAFVGASGCGKSTLMRLMLGFEQPASGSVSFDGQDISTIDVRLLRQQMGVVMQVSRVMPTEIYRNIIGTTSRTLQDAWDAAERSGLAEDIRAMPMGMHTYVSEGGGTLSGGQRQRLMIARAIVNKPKILFLDEATSALDNRTQAIVTESMDRMDATRIVIAHRLSTIINATTICYLEGGQIVEKGTYQELMDKNGKFAELARRQMV
ncbi:MAG: NHLP bacteriocin export ABC transporter permease/ATPase subunit [Vicinamibacterales bacterium]